MSDSNWIKISDRAPEFPAWLWHPEADFPTLKQSGSDYAGFGYTHWQPANLQPPAPPPRELTQREKDEQAYVTFVRTSVPIAYWDIWYGALAWEREQIDDDFFEALFHWRDNDRDRREQDDFIRDFFRARREGGNK